MSAYAIDNIVNEIHAAVDNGFLMVHSDRGEGAYRVTLVGETPVACTCKGYTYHGHCKHLDRAVALVNLVTDIVTDATNVAVKSARRAA